MLLTQNFDDHHTYRNFLHNADLPLVTSQRLLPPLTLGPRQKRAGGPNQIYFPNTRTTKKPWTLYLDRMFASIIISTTQDTMLQLSEAKGIYHGMHQRHLHGH